MGLDEDFEFWSRSDFEIVLNSVCSSLPEDKKKNCEAGFMAGLVSKSEMLRNIAEKYEKRCKNLAKEIEGFITDSERFVKRNLREV